MNVEPPAAAAELARIRAPLLAAAAAPIDPPSMQPLALILELCGEAMRERLFVVQANGGPEAALRPDFTLAAALHHIAAGAAEGRYICEGKAFRAAPPGRSDEPEEFQQLGLECFDRRDVARADAETAAVAWRAASAGGRGDLSLIFGDAALFLAFLESLGIAEPLRGRLARALSSPRRLAEALSAAAGPSRPAQGERLAALLGALPEVEAAGVLEELWALAGVEAAGGRSAAEIVHRLAHRAAASEAPRVTPEEAERIGAYLAIAGQPEAALAQAATLAGSERRALDAALAAWERRLAALADEGAPTAAMRLATAFSREFAYYDGVFFEVRSAALGDDRPVAGGGRYDGLFARLGARLACGAVGCMVRPARAVIGTGP